MKSMPAELQDVVKEAALEMQKYENELFIEEEKKLRLKLEKAGMTFNEVDSKAFASKAMGAVMKALSEDQRKLLEKLKAQN